MSNLNKKINFNIVLCGFMGCGKTTVGKQLSIQTGFSFIDTDNCIEKEASSTINEIFSICGESYFRNLERNFIKRIASLSKTVISTGGGSILNKDNVINLKKNGKIFFLNANINTITARLNSDFTRPLVKDKNSINNLFFERINQYINIADFIIDANKNVNEICSDIINKMGNYT